MKKMEKKYFNKQALDEKNNFTFNNYNGNNFMISDHMQTRTTQIVSNIILNALEEHDNDFIEKMSQLLG